MNVEMGIQQQLLGSMIDGRCKAETGIQYQTAYNSGSKCIRFTTPTIFEVLPPAKMKIGVWKTGILLQYEIYNNGTNLLFQLSLSDIDLKVRQKKRMEKFLAAAGAAYRPDRNGIIPVRQWTFKIGEDVKQAQPVLDEIFIYVLPFFEFQIRCWLKDPKHMILQSLEKVEPDTDKEGKETQSSVNLFERNPEARKKCLAYYGTSCQICGFDFGEFYGPEFAGKIEVHHIVPLSEIRQEYKVDPIKDLIPVCSNCHTALHSKEVGVYTPEELKQMIRHKE